MSRLVVRTLLLLSCAGLAAAVSTTNGYTCNDACGTSVGVSYTWCDVNKVNGACPSGTTSYGTLTSGCWD